MLIPKGSTIFVGVSAMHIDEDYYPDHNTFDPERFVKHPKLANDYAIGPDYQNRDKCFPIISPFRDIRCCCFPVHKANLLELHTIMGTVPADVSVPAFT